MTILKGNNKLAILQRIKYSVVCCALGCLFLLFAGMVDAQDKISAIENGISSKSSPATRQTLDWKPNPSLPETTICRPPNIHAADLLKLQEFKPTLVIEVGTSESRVFRICNRIKRTSIGDPRISEPVVVSENQFVILGMKPGTTTLAIWDDADNISVYKLVVKEQDAYTKVATVNSQREGSQIPSATNGTILIEEIKKVREVLLNEGETKFFKLPDDIVRSSVNDPRVASLSFPAENGIYLQGQSAGKASVFIWDCKGNILGMDVLVAGNKQPVALEPKRLQLAEKDIVKNDWKESPQIESWTGAQKEIITPAVCLPRKLIQLEN